MWQNWHISICQNLMYSSIIYHHYTVTQEQLIWRKAFITEDLIIKLMHDEATKFLLRFLRFHPPMQKQTNKHTNKTLSGCIVAGDFHNRIECNFNCDFQLIWLLFEVLKSGTLGWYAFPIWFLYFQTKFLCTGFSSIIFN